jgi:hypothetical protein
VRVRPLRISASGWSAGPTRRSVISNSGIMGRSLFPLRE